MCYILVYVTVKLNERNVDGNNNDVLFVQVNMYMYINMFIYSFINKHIVFRLTKALATNTCGNL